jgi:hypothetical protein
MSKRTAIASAFAAGAVVVFSLVSLAVQIQRYETNLCGDIPGLEGEAVDERDETRQNQATLDRLPMFPGARLADVELHPQYRCPEGEGDVVSILSSATYSVPAGTDKCSVVTYVEDRLRKARWTLSSLETAVEGGGARDTKGRRGEQSLDFLIGPNPTSYTIAIDGSSPYDNDTADHRFPCT